MARVKFGITETRTSRRACFVSWGAWAAVIFVLFCLPDSDVLDYVMIVAAAFLLLAWLALTVWSLVAAMRLFRSRTWQLASACVIMPVALPLAVYWAIPHAAYSLDYARFLVMRPTYDADVARLPGNGRRLAEFEWRGAFSPGGSIIGVVYDETDELGLPYERRSAAWKKRMEDTDLTCGGDGPLAEATALGGHYYLAYFGC